MEQSKWTVNEIDSYTYSDFSTEQGKRLIPSNILSHLGYPNFVRVGIC